MNPLTNAQKIEAADFDGDGKDDLMVIVKSQSPSITFATAFFTPDLSSQLIASHISSGAEVGDFKK